MLPALLRQHRRPQLHREVDLRREQVRGGEEGDGLGAVRVRQSGEDGDAPRLDRDIQARLRLHLIGDTELTALAADRRKTNIVEKTIHIRHPPSALRIEG